MDVLTLKQAGLTVYKKPHTGNKWYLPVCSTLKKDALKRLVPNHPGNWEEVDFDGCPTICYVVTGSLVRQLNKSKLFTSFYNMFSDCLGSGPAKEYFPELWIKANNIKAMARNKWEFCHGVKTRTTSHGSMSVRAAARLSI